MLSLVIPCFIILTSNNFVTNGQDVAINAVNITEFHNGYVIAAGQVVKVKQSVKEIKEVIKKECTRD